MTLLDFPQHVAAVVFTGGCDLRCPFCHNSPLVTAIDPAEKYNTEDVLKYLSSRKKLLDGVAISGGEPLLQVDIAGFIKKIKEMGFKVKLDTNGSFPDKLGELVEEKLVDYIAVDIKNCREKYPQTVGVPSYSLENLDRSMEILKNGGIDYEYRTTVVKQLHTVEDIIKIGEWIKGAPRYFLQNFADSGRLINADAGYTAHDKETLLRMKAAVSPFVGNVQVRGI